MALPTTVDSSTPAGSASPSLGDDQLRALKLFVVDVLGLPDNTSITQAAMDMDAGGLAQIIFADPAVEPASGEMGRNGSTLKYRIEDARTATTIRPFAVAATTTGVPAASIGVGMLFQAESADEVPSDFGALDFVASDVTAASEDTYASIMLRVAGRALDEKYRFGSTAGDGFAAIFAHAVTADRTYTLPDESGTFVTSVAKNTVRKTDNFALGSATWTDVTDLTITITTGARRVMLQFQGRFIGDDANNEVGIRFDIDGTPTSVLIQEIFVVTADRHNAGCHYLTDALTAASHTFKVQMQRAAGTNNVTLQAATAAAIFSAVEIP